VDWNKPNGSFPNDWTTIHNTVHVLDNFNAIYKPDERVFLYSSVLTPHPPMHTSSKWLERVNKSHLRAHMPVWNDWSEFHPFDSYMSISKNFADPSYTDDYLFNVSESYFSDVAIADDMHGQVMTALEASPAANNTWVIFISDHGEMHCEARQLWKNSLREASARVPLVITGPGIKKQVISSYTSLLDVMPTIIELAGGTVPPGLDGQSLVPLLFESEEIARSYGVTWSPREAFDEARPVYSQYHSNMGNTGSFMMVSRVDGAEMKLVTFGNTMPWFNETAYHPQLFNLTADPWELHDISASNPTLTASLVAQIEAFFGSTQDIDVKVKLNDQGLFKEYFEDAYDPDTLLKKLKNTYQGFDDSDLAKVNLFMSTTPVAPSRGE
jgi:arylsulfatase A-like enzyme